MCSSPWRGYGCIVDAFHKNLGIAGDNASLTAQLYCQSKAEYDGLSLSGRWVSDVNWLHRNSQYSSYCISPHSRYKLRPMLASTLTFSSFCSGGSQFSCVVLAGTLSCAFSQTSTGPDEEAATIALTEFTKNGECLNTHLHLKFHTAQRTIEPTANNPCVSPTRLQLALDGRANILSSCDLEVESKVVPSPHSHWAVEKKMGDGLLLFLAQRACDIDSMKDMGLSRICSEGVVVTSPNKVKDPWLYICP